LTQLAVRDGAEIIEQVMLQGDLAKLKPEERVRYYREVCRSLGLNELTRPFEYITLNGKLTLYARKDCTDQLRTIQGVGITKLERERLDDLYVVTAYASNSKGRQDSAIGAVYVKGLNGEALANALMKAETKAKRRVTLSLCGLGWTDESEVESIPAAQTVVVDQTTGEVLESRDFIPMREQDVDDRDMVRSADETPWKSWLQVLARAQKLGVKAQEITLPQDRNELRDYARQVTESIRFREEQLKSEDAARAAGAAGR
jgi:hypothetical protein